MYVCVCLFCCFSFGVLPFAIYPFGVLPFAIYPRSCKVFPIRLGVFCLDLGGAPKKRAVSERKLSFLLDSTNCGPP